MNAFGKPDLFF